MPKLPKTLAFAIAVICGLLIACGPFPRVGDSAFKVRGTIKLKSGGTPSDCRLRLFNDANRRKLDEVEIPPSFEKSFVIAPEEQDYYMEIQCAQTLVYTTRTLRLGDRKWYLQPVDLGAITLEDSTATGGQRKPRGAP